MLRFLAIRHLAVIDHLEVEFSPGLTVITGETGAGKSMLVEAIDLLLGGRASADLVRTGEDTATIQAIFERPDGTEIIVRREISSQGRSRAFIDDALATSTALRELGPSLVDLHGQHEHQTLLHPQEHAGLVDAYARHDDLLARVAQMYGDWRSAADALERTRLSAHDKAARIESVSFQLAEIDRVAPVPDEDEQLGAEQQVLANVDRLRRWSDEAYAALYDREGSALELLAIVWKRIEDLAGVDPRFEPFEEQRDEVKARLEDLAFMLRSYTTDLDSSPERLQWVEDRLGALGLLKKRFGPTLEEVLAKRQAHVDELAALHAGDDLATALEAQASQAGQSFTAAATELSKSRRAAGTRLAQALEEALTQLAMPDAKVDVRIQTVTDSQSSWSRRGADEVEFFLSPNPGEEVRPLARIASGGELSRIMLALKTLATADEPGRTLVFDEVDAGIGGAAADAVGARLQALANRSQVLCITHLPQIAARGSSHLHISKEVRDGRTLTTMARLSGDGREAEIAKMLTGQEVSPGFLASAREMLAQRQASEHKTKGESERPSMAKAKTRRRGA